MLVLSRKVGESLVINGNIIVTLVKIENGGKVRIGIEAPKEIKIRREELISERQES